MESLLPHRAPMILIDEVTSYDAETIQTALTIRESSLFVRDTKKVHAVLSMEYIAQSVAAHAGLLSGQKATRGVVISVPMIELMTPYFFVGQRLHVVATKQSENSEIKSYSGTIHSDKQLLLAKARVTIYIGSQVEQN